MDLMMDYLTKAWVLYADEREKRPFDEQLNKVAIRPDPGFLCPFCPENGHLTHSENFVYKDVRIVPNLYPAIGSIGLHEVLIESPRHDLRLKDAGAEAARDVLTCLKLRLGQIDARSNIHYVQVFKNEGARAGASLVHPHWQIIGLPFVPRRQQTMAESFNTYHEETGLCYLCHAMARASGPLTVLETERVLAWCPEASLFPFALNIAPKMHLKDLRSFSGSLLLETGGVLCRVLRAINAATDGADLNISVCRPAAGSSDGGHWHFFIQITPRTAMFAGFEISTGCAINPTPPDVAAARLRAVL